MKAIRNFIIGIAIGVIVIYLLKYHIVLNH